MEKTDLGKHNCSRPQRILQNALYCDKLSAGRENKNIVKCLQHEGGKKGKGLHILLVLPPYPSIQTTQEFVFDIEIADYGLLCV